MPTTLMRGLGRGGTGGESWNVPSPPVPPHRASTETNGEPASRIKQRSQIPPTIRAHQGAGVERRVHVSCGRARAHQDPGSQLRTWSKRVQRAHAVTVLLREELLDFRAHFHEVRRRGARDHHLEVGPDQLAVHVDFRLRWISSVFSCGGCEWKKMKKKTN